MADTPSARVGRGERLGEPPPRAVSPVPSRPLPTAVILTSMPGDISDAIGQALPGQHIQYEFKKVGDADFQSFEGYVLQVQKTEGRITSLVSSTNPNASSGWIIPQAGWNYRHIRTAPPPAMGSVISGMTQDAALQIQNLTQQMQQQQAQLQTFMANLAAAQLEFVKEVTSKLHPTQPTDPVSGTPPAFMADLLRTNQEMLKEMVRIAGTKEQSAREAVASVEDEKRSEATDEEDEDEKAKKLERRTKRVATAVEKRYQHLYSEGVTILGIEKVMAQWTEMRTRVTSTDRNVNSLDDGLWRRSIEELEEVGTRLVTTTNTGEAYWLHKRTQMLMCELMRVYIRMSVGVGRIQEAVMAFDKEVRKLLEKSRTNRRANPVVHLARILNDVISDHFQARRYSPRTAGPQQRRLQQQALGVNPSNAAHNATDIATTIPTTTRPRWWIRKGSPPALLL